MKLKLKNFNWYGIKHDVVMEHFEGDFTYVGTFCVKDEYTPRAVYFNSKPNRTKLHKDYMTLQGQGSKATHVSGIDKKDMEEWRYQDGLLCKKCGDLVYSINRHDCHWCKCKKCAIDGGRDYSRVLGHKKDYTLVTIDLIKGETKENV